MQGHIAAQYNYGISVANGEIGAADPTEGAFWLFLAAKGGYEKAMIHLAVTYRNGNGVYPNGIMMLYWYAKAASFGFPRGVYDLGLCLWQEEVLSGNAALGRNLTLQAERMQEDAVRASACEIARQVLQHIQKNAFNI